MNPGRKRISAGELIPDGFPPMWMRTGQDKSAASRCSPCIEYVWFNLTDPMQKVEFCSTFDCTLTNLIH